MTGVLYGLLGLVFIPIYVVFAVIGMLVQPAAQANNSPGAGWAVAIGGALVLGLFMPVLYGVFGFIFGAISAALYNVIARWIGGIEVEVE